MKHPLFLLTTAAAALLLSAGALQAATIRCESNNGDYRACNVDTRGGVRLSRQLSSQGCWQNDTWGYDLNRIWVDRGCRAEFTVGGSSSSSSKDNAVAGAIVLGLVGAAIIASNKDRDRRDDYRYQDRYDDRYGRPGYYGDPRSTVRCESNDNRFRYCGAPGRGHVEIYRQISSAPCVYGRSWGQERGRIWVTNGCRADFAVY